MLIDTHCHLSFKAFKNDYTDVIKRAQENDVQMITVGSNTETSKKAITIAKEDGVFASIGIHPTHTDDDTFDAGWFSEAVDDKSVVAIGECGIDYYHLDDAVNRHPEQSVLAKSKDLVSIKKSTLLKQEELFLKHLNLAKEKDLPVILHTRDGKTESTGHAYEHLYHLIKDFGYFKCVVHCFGGSWEWAQKFLDLGLIISFTGIVTFKNASEELIDVVQRVPKDKFMIETDAPYLSPEPYRGKQNEPAYVEYIAKGIASIRGKEYDDITAQTTKTAKKFFNL